MLKSRKGTSMVGTIIGVMIVLIILVQAVIPTIQSSITDANISGTAGDILNLLPLFLAIAGLIFVVALMKLS